MPLVQLYQAVPVPDPQCPWLCGTAVTGCWFAPIMNVMSCARTSLTPCSWPGCRGRTTSGGSERACKSQVRYVGGGFPKTREMLGICIVSVVRLVLLCALSHTTFKSIEISVLPETVSICFNLRNSNSRFALQLCFVVGLVCVCFYFKCCLTFWITAAACHSAVYLLQMIFVYLVCEF